MRTHENLEVWKKAIDFVVLIYGSTENFPSEEKFGLVSQLRRASVSIPANIAEGAARNYTKETLHFISIAQGSASEVSTEILIGFKLGFLSEANYCELRDKCIEIGKMMTGWSQYLRSRESRDL